MNTDRDQFAAPFAAVIAIPDQRIDTMLGIRISTDRIVRVEFLPEDSQQIAPQETVAVKAVDQIKRYFSAPDWHFDLPIHFFGTEFQNRVWNALTQIKMGQTVTYGELATRLCSSPRAVGNACRRNPLPIIVPCHRVVSKAGLGGFSGQREGKLVNLKQWLVNREQAYAS